MDARSITLSLPGGKWHGTYGTARCVVHDDRNPSMTIRDGDHGLFVKCHSQGCDPAAILSAFRNTGRLRDRHRDNPVPWSPPARKVDDTDRTVTPRAIWRRALPGDHPTLRRYLDGRGILGSIPATIRFLPARGDHAPAMVTAFGLTTELEPGVLEIADDAVQAVHLTRLRTDGSGKAEATPDRPNKIMLGSVSGSPIVLAPLNDLLGLTIVEGVESGLSVAAATGLGVWAAGSASLLPALADAVPSYADCITVASDPDPAGRKFGAALVERLVDRGLNARLGLLEGGA